MGKSQKYSEDKLLEGVVKYSEFYRKKIKATELAKWCKYNVDGLEEVRDYNFIRNTKERDDKTGKMIERQKLCTQRIEEINRSLSSRVSINSNLLLRASNIDVIFEQPQSIQRKLIIETREMFDSLLSKNYKYERENEILRSINRNQNTSIEEVNFKISDLKRAFKKISKQVNYLMKEIDAEKRKIMLAKMGVKDEVIDLNVYMENLQQSMDDVMDIKKILFESSKHDTVLVRESSNFGEQREVISENYVKDVIMGIDFD